MAPSVWLMSRGKKKNLYGQTDLSSSVCQSGLPFFFFLFFLFLIFSLEAKITLKYHENLQKSIMIVCRKKKKIQNFQMYFQTFSTKLIDFDQKTENS